jgi:hypothetical protein
VERSQEVERLSTGLSVIGDESDWWLEGPDDASPDAQKAAPHRSKGRPRTRNPLRFEIPSHTVKWFSRVEPNITKEQCRQASEEARREAIGWSMFRASQAGRNTANNDRESEKKHRILKLYRDNNDIILDYSLSIKKVVGIILHKRDSLGLGERALWDVVALIRTQDRNWRARKAR